MADSSSSRICANCGVAEVSPGVVLSFCSRCHRVSYCSRACQAKHWRRRPVGHKQECGVPEEQQPQRREPPPSDTAPSSPGSPGDLASAPTYIAPSEVPSLRKASMVLGEARWDEAERYFDEELMPQLSQLEELLSHDAFDQDAQDDGWWGERRLLYVRLYRFVAQLQDQLTSFCGANALEQPNRGPTTVHDPLNTFILLPPARSEEQGAVEAEGQRQARDEPNRRVLGEGGFRDFFVSEDNKSVQWPCKRLIRALQRAESTMGTNEVSALGGGHPKMLCSNPCDIKNESEGGRDACHRLAPALRDGLRFKIGTRVFACVGDGWYPGTVLWRLHCEACSRSERQCAPYQILMDEPQPQPGGPQEGTNWLVMAPIDSDLCVKLKSDTGPFAGKTAVSIFPAPTKAFELLNEACNRLFQAWWVVGQQQALGEKGGGGGGGGGDGYCWADLGGLLDVAASFNGQHSRACIDMEVRPLVQVNARLEGFFAGGNDVVGGLQGRPFPAKMVEAAHARLEVLSEHICVREEGELMTAEDSAQSQPQPRVVLEESTRPDDDCHDDGSKKGAAAEEREGLSAEELKAAAAEAVNEDKRKVSNPRIVLGSPGASLAKLLEALIGGAEGSDVGDKNTCAWCGKQRRRKQQQQQRRQKRGAGGGGGGGGGVGGSSSGGGGDEDEFQACSRCRRAIFCSVECSTLAWKGTAAREGHQVQCSDRATRCKRVLQDLGGTMGGTSLQGGERCPLPALEKALELCGERVKAATLLLTLLFTGGLEEMATDFELGCALKMLFGARVKPKDLRQLEAALPVNAQAHLAKHRAEVQAKKEVLRVGMMPVAVLCGEIHQLLQPPNINGMALIRTLDGRKAALRTNKDLLDHCHALIRKAPDPTRTFQPHGSIPGFLALVDELLTPPIQYGGPVPEAQAKRLAVRLRLLTREAWLAYSRAFDEIERGTTDDSVLEQARKREYVRHNGTSDGKEITDWILEPGNWMSKKYLK